MFGKLPEIFGRDFAVGYFLPSAIFLAVNLKMMPAFGIALPTTVGDALGDAVTLGLLAWLGGIFLLAVNRILIRAVEGYGDYNPARLFKRLELSRFAKLQVQVAELNLQRDAYKSKGEEPPPWLQARRIKVNRQAAERFPDAAAWLLPTSFGNTIRAFEVYPRVVYGMDSIYGWGRLLAVISKDYRELVDAAKAQMDFWINLLFLGVLTALEFTALALYAKGPGENWWVVVVALLTSIISYEMARNAAVAWGDLVKAAFDVFLPELRKKLEFAFPADKAQERALWVGFSQTIIYRLDETMPARVRQESKEEN